MHSKVFVLEEVATQVFARMAKVKKSRGMPKPDNSSDDANGAAFSLATDAMDPNLALLFSTSVCSTWQLLVSILAS